MLHDDEDKENNEDDEDNEDDGDLSGIINGEKVDVRLIDSSMNEEPIDLYRLLLLKNAKSGLKVTQKGSRVFIKPFNGGGISFELINNDGNAILTDDGAAFKKLKEKNVYGSDAILRAVDVILSEHNIFRQGEVLGAAVDADNVFVGFCELFVAVQRICALDIGKVKELAEKRRLDDLRFNMMERLIKNNPKMKRTEAILYMKEKYIKIKDSNDFDEIIICATAVKEFGMLSDEQFEQCRKQITGE